MLKRDDQSAGLLLEDENHLGSTDVEVYGKDWMRSYKRERAHIERKYKTAKLIDE